MWVKTYQNFLHLHVSILIQRNPSIATGKIQSSLVYAILPLNTNLIPWIPGLFGVLLLAARHPQLGQIQQETPFVIPLVTNPTRISILIPAFPEKDEDPESQRIWTRSIAQKGKTLEYLPAFLFSSGISCVEVHYYSQHTDLTKMFLTSWYNPDLDLSLFLR